MTIYALGSLAFFIAFFGAALIAVIKLRKCAAKQCRDTGLKNQPTNKLQATEGLLAIVVFGLGALGILASAYQPLFLDGIEESTVAKEIAIVFLASGAGFFLVLALASVDAVQPESYWGKCPELARKLAFSIAALGLFSVFIAFIVRIFTVVCIGLRAPSTVECQDHYVGIAFIIVWSLLIPFFILLRIKGKE